jgi:hypothetical protein
VELEESQEQWTKTMQNRPGARSKRGEVRLVLAREPFRLFDAVRELVPADRGSDRRLQIGTGFPGLDQYRSQLRQKAHFLVDRPRIADQDFNLALLG